MAINLLFYVIKNRFKKSIKIVLSPFFLPVIPSFVGAGFPLLFSHFILHVHSPFISF
jgi:putative Mn2+ efflux pump MntP